MDEVIFQEHAFILEKAPGVGFGIAISGGRDNPGAQTGDTSIIISDVIKQGPANDKLKVNDIVTRVNGKPMFNMEHRQAVKELKNAGQRVELTIKRKVVVRMDTPPPGRLSRSRSRDFDSLPRNRDHRSRSRDYDESRRRRHSRSRDRDSSSRHHRRSRRYSRSRSRTPPRRRSRSYSRSPSRSSRHRGRSRSPSPTANRRRSGSRGSSPSYRRSRSRTRSRTPPRSRSASFSPSSRSVTPPRRDSPPRLEKHKSIEDLRNRLSPLSPDPEGVTPDADMMTFPVKTREPKTVVLKKTRWNNSYGLKLGTRIFIQDIQPGSLADKSVEVTAGDTILMINGRNVDNKTVQEAIQIIGLSKDKVTMLVKKEDGGTVSLPAQTFNPPAAKPEPKKDSDSEEEEDRRRSRKSSVSKHSEKVEKPIAAETSTKVAAKPDKKQFGIRVLPTGAPAPSKSSSSSSGRSTPEPAPRSKHDTSQDREYVEPPGSEEDDGPILPPTARQVIFTKGKSVGIRLAGGNDVGIFVASVQDGSPAAKQGLKMGDQILSVNNINFRNIIREEAVLTLMGLPAGEEVNIIAQPQSEAYKKVLEHGTGDSFYIRTHFKYEKNGQHEMSFRRGSAFRISDTLYQGMVGYWLAVRIGRNNMEIERGVIPNRSRAEQLKMVQDKKIAQLRERSNRGIGRRLMKNQKSDPPVSSSASAMFPAYERVVLREAGFKRPVVVLGPLADIARERLAGDYPNLYEIARNEGTVSGQKSNRKGVIRLNTIKDIIEKDKHAILDITPTAVEKLNYAQLYPIVVFLESQSKAAVKDLRQKLAATEEEKKKKAGKLFDRANKLQRGYNHVFTDTIQLVSGNDLWYQRLHSTIRDQQSTPVWVSEDKLGGGGEETEEGVTVPGDDDQFSYVSAPASDYSVTTVGSEMLGGAEEEEVDARPVVRQQPKLPSSSSSSEEEDGNKFGDDDFDYDTDEDPPLDKPVPPHNIPDPEPEPEPESESQSEPEPEPMPEAPPRDKKIHNRPPVHEPSSSSSSEEEPPVPIVAPKPPSNNRVITRVEPPRGKQEIPQGRFDPQSFLKSHIRGLKQVSKDDEEDLSPREQPMREEPIPEVKATTNYHKPPSQQSISKPPPSNPAITKDSGLTYMSAKPYTRQSATIQPHQPVYAQVNKNRTSSVQPPNDRRTSSGRDYAGEIDSFISTDPYRRSTNKPQDERPPVRYEPPRQEAAPYNRFAGSTHPKPYQPFNSSKPQSYQRPPVSNGVPQKSKFQQEKYKDYMSQIKPSSSNPTRQPYKPGPAYKNGPTDNMYDSGVDIYDNARPKKEAAPVSPATIDEDDPQVVATARGVFDSNGGVLSSVETGVSIHIPKLAIRPGVRQEIYFKVCRDNTALPPLDKDKGETLLSPLVMCGPHGLQFDHPVELRLPHCASMTSDGWSFALKTSDPGEPSQWHNVNVPNESNNYDVGSNSVSVLIDHF